MTMRSRALFLPSSTVSLGPPSPMQKTKHLQNFTLNRQESVKNIEKLLHEVGSIFQKITSIVKIQDSLIDRIDGNVSKSVQNVEKGKKMLVKSLEEGRKGIMVRVMLVIICFLVVYIIFS